MNDLAAQSHGHDEGATVDHCARTGGSDRLNMACATSNSVEQALASKHIGRVGDASVAWRHFRTSNELREVIDIGQSQVIGNIFRIPGCLSDGRRILGAQPTGDTHLIQVRIRYERQQAAVLILPSEAPDARLSRCFQYWNFDNLT